MATKRTPSQFDPFTDRLSRDIRNSLSTAFIKSLRRLDLTPAKEVSTAFLLSDPATIYRVYIDERLERYEEAWRLIREQDIGDAFSQALVLWDQELFFEVHEILEHEWLQAEGEEKEILQAMIRAAGVYVQLSHGNVRGARKMANKALEVLTPNRASIPVLFNLDLLLESLRNLDPVPPKIRNAQ